MVKIAEDSVAYQARELIRSGCAWRIEIMRAVTSADAACDALRRMLRSGVILADGPGKYKIAEWAATERAYLERLYEMRRDAGRVGAAQPRRKPVRRSHDEERRPLSIDSPAMKAINALGVRSRWGGKKGIQERMK